MKVYNQFTRPADPGITPTAKSKTQQQFADECDINFIMRRQQAGQPLPNAAGEPIFGDFVGVDYQGAVELLNAAKEQFMAIPAKTRLEFNNDPAELIRFLENPENMPRAIELGLMKPPAAEQILKVQLSQENLDILSRNIGAPSGSDQKPT